MDIVYLYYSFAYFFLVFTLYIGFRRVEHLQVHWRVVTSAALLTIFVAISYWLGYLHNAPNDPTNTYEDKIQWTIAISLLTNAVIQLLIWIIYDFLLRGRWVRLPKFLFNMGGLILFGGIVLFTVKTLFDINLTGLLVGSTVVSAIIGLAFQDTLGNIIAGISLQLESPFKIGDWVILGGHEGRVVSQNWRTVTIQTREFHFISLTNKFVSEDKIINYYRPRKKQIHNHFISLGYEHPPNQVISVLNDLLMEIEEVDIVEGNVGTFLMEYGDSGISYCLKFWINDYADLIPILNKVLSRAWYTLKRNGINIPFPIRDVRMTQYPLYSEEESRKIQDNLITKKLKRLDVLKALNDEQISELAHSARLDIYGKDALLVKEGNPGDSMFIITRGSVKITVKGASGEIRVGERASGGFFGEMSLLTGEPRSASVWAAEDLETIIIDKQGFSEVLLTDPGLLELFVDVVESHKEVLQSAIEEDRKNFENQPKRTRDVLLKKIRSYFGLTGT